jgi:glycolate oxidase iron-sulfur subunit
MLVLESCGQPETSPNTNAATARVLDRLGVSLLTVPRAGCCGAVAYHLGAQAEGLNAMRANIDAWWPLVEQGAEAIVVSASGCGAMIKDYGHLLAGDAGYAQKAARVSELARDVAEVIAAEKPALRKLLAVSPATGTVAFHPPCTLQHGMKMKGQVEALLSDLGFTLTPVADSHMCCGSAGTYSILQSTLSKQLLARRIAALEVRSPQEILTANIGCQLHLQSATGLTVRHWIEALDERLAG